MSDYPPSGSHGIVQQASSHRFVLLYGLRGLRETVWRATKTTTLAHAPLRKYMNLGKDLKLFVEYLVGSIAGDNFLGARKP